MGIARAEEGVGMAGELSAEWKDIEVHHTTLHLWVTVDAHSTLS